MAAKRNIFVLLCALLLAVPAQAAEFDLARLNEGGYVVLLRHVTAGGADGDNFNLADCGTQRQVGATGRAQAEALAARFKAAGIVTAQVLTSQWCRARQTAELLGLGAVTDEPALNYYHWKLGSEETMNATLRGFFSALAAPARGVPLVLVSHSTAFTAMGLAPPKAGGGLVLKPGGGALPQVAGEIPAPQ